VNFPDKDDVLIRARPWLVECPQCDAGLMTECLCPDGDVRSIILDLVREVEALRDECK
jgi:hypothetical protein